MEWEIYKKYGKKPHEINKKNKKINLKKRRRKAYKNYLTSEKWRNRRKEYLKKWGYNCQECGYSKPGKIQIHHLNYFRLGEELDSDLIALCKRCHRRKHL